MKLAEELSKVIKGEVDATAKTREFYSHDASLFELKPEAVVFPQDSADVQKLVSYVAKNKATNPKLSITPRSAGTDMSGGSIGESIVADFTRHMNQLYEVSATKARVQPGMYYRDFEVETLKHNALMPSYPASRGLCAIGGIVNNNSGGEKSLEYGKTMNFVDTIKVVLADGKEYELGPITKAQLDQKMKQKDFEGKLYSRIFDLVDTNYAAIKAAKPHVSKNATGYNLWDVWDRKTGIFNLANLVIGGQGTLGILTEAKFKLVPHKPHSGLLVLFLTDISHLGDVINKVLGYKPATFESFDDVTLWLSIKFMPSFLKMLGTIKFIHLLISLIPDAFMLMHGIPKLILMVEFNGDTRDEVREKIHALHKDLDIKHSYYHISATEEDPTEESSEKYWIMRRQSFQLLRSKVKDKHTAPFIDDLVVNPEHLPDFLPKMRLIIKKYDLFATIAGHMGDGNFHIIPLMKLEDRDERAKLEPAMRETNELVLSYGGSLSGEHNDGMIRGPWLEQMYGPKITGYFKDVKRIFDPENIFNPHKKADSDWDYSMAHVRDHF
ncbi:FAD-binding oxidoreductase [bacterium]|nr:MAG: FAD-binding oxidoreductase [bacterium]